MTDEIAAWHEQLARRIDRGEAAQDLQAYANGLARKRGITHLAAIQAIRQEYPALWHAFARTEEGKRVKNYFEVNEK